MQHVQYSTCCYSLGSPSYPTSAQQALWQLIKLGTPAKRAKPLRPVGTSVWPHLRIWIANWYGAAKASFFFPGKTSQLSTSHCHLSMFFSCQFLFQKTTALGSSFSHTSPADSWLHVSLADHWTSRIVTLSLNTGSPKPDRVWNCCSTRICALSYVYMCVFYRVASHIYVYIYINVYQYVYISKISYKMISVFENQVGKRRTFGFLVLLFPLTLYGQ